MLNRHWTQKAAEKAFIAKLDELQSANPQLGFGAILDMIPAQYFIGDNLYYCYQRDSRYIEKRFYDVLGLPKVPQSTWFDTLMAQRNIIRKLAWVWHTIKTGGKCA